MDSRISVVIMMVVSFLFQGCARVYQRDHNAVAFYEIKDLQERWGDSTVQFSKFRNQKMLEIDRRVRHYLADHSLTSPEVARAMLNYRLIRGMTPEEVMVITGKVGRLSSDALGREIWEYGSLLPELRSIQLVFLDGRVIEIKSKVGVSFPY